MWFEILPSFGIITVALAIPGYALYGIHKAVLGNVSFVKDSVYITHNTLLITYFILKHRLIAGAWNNDGNDININGIDVSPIILTFAMYFISSQHSK